MIENFNKNIKNRYNMKKILLFLLAVAIAMAAQAGVKSIPQTFLITNSVAKSESTTSTMTIT